MSISGLRRKRRNREGTTRIKEVTKLIDELRADLATSKESINHWIDDLRPDLAISKNEMNHRIDELRADLSISKKEMNHRIDELRADLATSKKEMNQRIDESICSSFPKKEPSEIKIWSIRNIFTVSYLDGLRELADENLNWIVKTVWLLILFLNLGLLAYGLIPIVKDYRKEVTITKVHQIETNMSELNRPSICLPLFEDFLYLRSENNSKDVLHSTDNQSLLYLGYIKAMMPHLASSGLWLSHIPSENLTWSEFESLPARSSFSRSHENASLLSQNVLYDLLYSWGIGQTDLETFEQSKFQYVTKVYSEILLRGTLDDFTNDTSICLPMSLLQDKWIAADGKEVPYFQYQYYASADRINLSLIHQMTFQPLHFNAKIFPLSVAYLMSSLEEEYRHKMDFIQYLLVPTKYIHLNLTRQPCYDALGEIYPRGFGESICFHDCLWRNHAILFNCSFWEDLNPDEQSNINVCHVFDIFHQLRSNRSQICKNDQKKLWCHNKTMRSVKEWNQLLMQTYRELVIDEASKSGDCKSKCAKFTYCEEWELQHELLYKDDSVELINDINGLNSPSGLRAGRYYRISPFVSVNEDVLKASKEEFISNLGGLIGFYFGASICGYMHLLLFLLIIGCRKITKIANKPASGSRRSNGEPIGEQ